MGMVIISQILVNTYNTIIVCTFTFDVLNQRRDWLDLFPFLATRRPDSYGILTEPVADNISSADEEIKGVKSSF